MEKRHPSNVTPSFQILMFIIASLMLVVIFYRPFVAFNINEVLPIPANYSDVKAIPIYTGLTIHHFMDSESVKNNVSIDATVWFAYDPALVKREQIEQFTFDSATIEKNKGTYVKQGDQEIASFDVLVHAKMDFNFKKYPLDDHRIWFNLKNSALPVERYHFITSPDAFVLGDRAHMTNCVSNNIIAKSGITKQPVILPDGQHEMVASRVLYSFECNPIDMRHFLNIFLPLYLIFFLTLFSFSFIYSEHTTDVPGIAAAGAPALFAYRFVIESISPNVSYFMVSDYLFFLYLGLSLFTFLSISWALNYPVKFKKIIIIGLYMLMLLGCAAISYTI